MRIIKEGVLPPAETENLTKRFECGYCKCIFEAEPIRKGDKDWNTLKRMKRKLAKGNINNASCCPTCGRMTFANPWARENMCLRKE